MQKTYSLLFLFFVIAACTREEPSPLPPAERTLVQFSATEAWLRLYFKEIGPDGEEGPVLMDNIKVFAFDTSGNILAAADLQPNESITLELEGNFNGQHFHLGIGALSEQSGLSGMLFGFVPRGHNWQLDTESPDEEIKNATVRLTNIPEVSDGAGQQVYYLYSNYTKYLNSLQQGASEVTIEAIEPSPLYVGWTDQQTGEQTFKLQASADFTGTNEIDVSEASGHWHIKELSNPYESKWGYNLYNFTVSAETNPSPKQIIEMEDMYISQQEPDQATIKLPMPEGVEYSGFSLELDNYFIVYSGSPMLEEVPYMDLSMDAPVFESGGQFTYNAPENADFYLAYFEDRQKKQLQADFMAILPPGAHTFHFPEIYDVFTFQEGLPALEEIEYTDAEVVSYDNIHGYTDFLELYRNSRFEQTTDETTYYFLHWSDWEEGEEGGRKKQNARLSRRLPFRK